MDLKEIKKITAYARKSGIKSLKMNGLELEFHESALISKPTRKLIPVEELLKGTKQEAEASFEEINAWIHQKDEEAI